MALLNHRLNGLQMHRDSFFDTCTKCLDDLIGLMVKCAETLDERLCFSSVPYSLDGWKLSGLYKFHIVSDREQEGIGGGPRTKHSLGQDASRCRLCRIAGRAGGRGGEGRRAVPE